MLRLRCFFVAALLLAGPAAAERLAMRSFTTSDGLSSNTVYALTQDRRGFLWIGTYDGLSRFDGRNFTRFGKADGLPALQVYVLAATRDGALWVGTRSGLLRLGPEAEIGRPRFEPVALPVASAGQPLITALAEDGAGRLWIGTGAGLFVGEPASAGAFRELALDGVSLNVGWLTLDAEGSAWVVTQLGLRRVLRDGAVRPYPVDPQPVNGAIEDGTSTLLADREGRLWIGRPDGTYVFKPEPEASVDREDPRPLARRARVAAAEEPSPALPQLPGEALFLPGGHSIDEAYVHSFATGRDGEVWIGTIAGLREFAHGRLRDLGASSGVRRQQINALYEDRNGDLWLGSEVYGLLRIARGGFTQFDAADGIAQERATSIFEGRRGDLMVVAGRCHLYRFTGERFDEVTPPDVAQVRVPGWGWGQYFLEDRDGGWWMPTSEGLFEYAPVGDLGALRQARPRRHWRAGSGLSGDDVFRVYQDRAGAIWVSVIAAEPLLVRRPGSDAFEPLADYRRLRGASPTAFAEDAAGNLWVGVYTGGLARLRGGHWESFEAAAGVPEGFVRDLHVDRRGRLWLATSGNGVARSDDPTAERPSFRRWTTADGLSSDAVTCLTEDEAGRIYIGTAHGVDRMDPESGAVRVFTTDDGLPDETAWTCHAARDGALWFGTAAGIWRFDPSREPRPAEPQIALAGIRAGGVPMALPRAGETLQVPADRRTLDFEYVGIGLGIGSRLRFQYQLAGLDAAWSPPQKEQSVHYGRLPPGRYRFRVRALTGDGLSSAQDAEARFVVLAPLWRQPWFLALAALALGAAAWSAYRVRLQRLLEVERVRTRIAADLHDDIGSGLSHIGLLGEMARERVSAEPAAASAMLGQIAESARELVDTTSDIAWAIDPRRDDLDSLIVRLHRFAADLFEARGVELEFSAPANAASVALTPAERRELYLLLKEAIHNVAKHARARRATVRIELSGGGLTAEVSDDGVGIADGARTAAEAAGHQGLPSLARRAAALGGEVRLDSTPGQGTRIRLRMPLTPRRSSLA